jgi:hypothetical protein
MCSPEDGRNELEFLELLNTSGREIDLSGWRIEGIDYTFPIGERSIVPSGATIVVARSPAALYDHQHCEPSAFFGPFGGKLDDDGEILRVLDAGPGYPATVDYLRYENGGAWPPMRPGYSLELAEVAADSDNDAGSVWRLSATKGGTPGVAFTSFLRGDADGNGTVNLADAVHVLSFLFRRGQPPGCLDAADSDDSGAVNVTDGVYLLNHLLRGGPPPPEPYPTAGMDLTWDSLECPPG